MNPMTQREVKASYDANILVALERETDTDDENAEQQNDISFIPQTVDNSGDDEWELAGPIARHLYAKFYKPTYTIPHRKRFRLDDVDVAPIENEWQLADEIAMNLYDKFFLSKSTSSDLEKTGKNGCATSVKAVIHGDIFDTTPSGTDSPVHDTSSQTLPCKNSNLVKKRAANENPTTSLSDEAVYQLKFSCALKRLRRSRELTQITRKLITATSADPVDCEPALVAANPVDCELSQHAESPDQYTEDF